MILLIDNYDSFTFNLYQQLESLGAETRVVTHDAVTIKAVKRMRPSRIVISPGPGRPADSGISSAVIRSFCRRIPILGVCLGHECIGEVFGARVVHAKKILHGKTSEIYHRSDGIFRGIESPLEAARYHSLVIDRVPDGFDLTAWDGDDEIMAVAHRELPVTGIQFHPESFMTPSGNAVIKNFLYED